MPLKYLSTFLELTQILIAILIVFAFLMDEGLFWCRFIVNSAEWEQFGKELLKWQH